jgi:hypothetical protein
MICDITYESSDDFSTATNTATVAVIFNMATSGIPDFYSNSKKDLFDFITDYDFELMEKSEEIQFNIFGNDSDKIDTFFTHEIVQIIADNPYKVEGKRGVMLVHNVWDKVLAGERLEDLLNFVDQLATEVVKEERGMEVAAE